jgi:hypothetical protein
MDAVKNEVSKLIARSIKGLKAFDYTYHQIQEVITLLEYALDVLHETKKVENK